MNKNRLAILMGVLWVLVGCGGASTPRETRPATATAFSADGNTRDGSSGRSMDGNADWPQWGGSPSRNNAPEGTGIPVRWKVGKFDDESGQWCRESSENILWVARLGTQSYGTPAIAGGKVFCAGNNGAGYLKRYPPSVDLGCLFCFRAEDGRLLWQLSREKHPAGRDVDWPEQGLCSTPLVEGKRAWVVTNRGEVACLDTEGFRDGVNDGPYTAEPSTADDEADIVWLFDMIQELGVVPHNMSSCSVTAAGDLLLVCTSNGVDDSHTKVAAPQAPSFLAFDKHTGKLVWADNSPGENILHGQWGSPAHAVLGGVPQAIFPGGDGWLYSFLAQPTADGKPKLLWKFDCNPKQTIWKPNGRGDRNELIATPVIWEGRVYIATGQDPEYGEGAGCLWCIDPTKRGDVSAEIVVDRQGRPVPPRRVRPVEPENGETVRPNPNSAALWHYHAHDANGDGKLDFNETMHRALGMPAIKDGLLVIADLAGLLHCLDARTGKVHWTHDMLAAMWGSPLLVDGKIYMGDEDGDVAVLELSPQKRLLAENNMGASVYSTPVVARNVLYIATRTHLLAIGQKSPPASAVMPNSKPTEKTIGLDRYRLRKGPICVAGVRDNLSGIAHNPATKSLWAVLNGPEELLELDRDGRVLRTVALSGFSDTEDVTILGDGRLAVVEEGRATLALLKLPPMGQVVLDRQAAELFHVPDGPMGNTGIEGVAYDAAGRRFYLLKEKLPPALYEVRLAEESSCLAAAKARKSWEFGPQTVEIRDAAGCYFDPLTGHLLVISDESRCLVECTVAGKEVARLPLPDIPQGEGVTMDDQRTIYIVSEPNLFYVLGKEDTQQ
jgi:uncharacterized protein YjiK/outer membrane protein assembly factor BamB